MDEAGTAEFTALCPDKTNLSDIFGYAISLGIDANDYIAEYPDDPNVNIASDSMDTEYTAPPELTLEALSAAIASVLHAEIGTFRTGSGLIDDDGEPGYVRISQCELNSINPTGFDVSSITAEVLIR